MPFDLEFTLVQHTPLIHFQHTQPNATLRATEVKPKLDRFIIKKLGLATCKQQGWLIGDGEQEALDYKLKITILQRGDRNEREGNVIIIPPERKNWIKDQSLKLEIFSLHEGLIGKIDELMLPFFALHNFGTRQNKTWGCFSAGKTPEEAEDESLFVNQLKSSGKSVYVKTIERNYPYDGTVETQVRIDWQRLKTGLNFPPQNIQRGGQNPALYNKSLLFEYMCKYKGLRWEKRHIKKEINRVLEEEDTNSMYLDQLYYRREPINLRMIKNPKTGQVDEKIENTFEDEIVFNYRFVRALLGLAEHNEYLVGQENNHSRRNEYIKYQVVIKGKDNGIDRFKAPVTFKIFSDHIYVIVEEIPKDMYNAQFDFVLKLKEKNDWNKWVTVNNSDLKLDPLKTPANVDEFDLEQFMKWAMPKLNYTKI